MGTARRRMVLFLAFACAASFLALAIWRQERYVIDVYAAMEASSAGNQPEARQQIERVLRDHPNSLEANRVAERIFVDELDWTDAETAARRLMARRSDDPQATLALIIVEKRTNRCEEADSIENRLVRHNNDYALYVSQLICAPNQSYKADILWPGNLFAP